MRCALLLAGFSVLHTHAQTSADSGWVPLFNGTNLNGLYVYAVGTGIVPNAAQTTFTVQNGQIRCSGTPNGYLGTVRQYSWYRVRVQYMWPVGTSAGANAGLLIHLDSAAVFSGSVTTANRPRSIEINMRRDTNYPWSLWSAQNLGPYITTTVSAIPGANIEGSYLAGGIVWTNDPWTTMGRVIAGAGTNPELPLGQWNQGEANLFGDSGVMILNGQVRTRGRNFQLRQNIANPNPRIVCNRGNIGLQSEGAQIFYRNFEIMFIDSTTGLPVSIRKDKRTFASGYSSMMHMDGTLLERLIRNAPPQYQGLSLYGVEGRKLMSFDLADKRMELESTKISRFKSGVYWVRWSLR